MFIQNFEDCLITSHIQVLESKSGYEVRCLKGSIVIRSGKFGEYFLPENQFFTMIEGFDFHLYKTEGDLQFYKVNEELYESKNP